MKNNKTNYRLGLDLGTNSIGWTMVELNEEKLPTSIIKSGVRIFSDGRNDKNKEPLAVARRVARGIRRRGDRILQRKKDLLNYLTKNQFFPSDELERQKLKILNPYELRTKALDEKLSKYEIGRALIHLNQRRGFKSNRKDVESKKDTKLTTGQNGLRVAVKEGAFRTLGEYLYQRLLDKKTTHAKDGEENMNTLREMYENEYDLIVNSQSKFHQDIESNIWQEIRDIIFYQRPLKPQEKGVCNFLRFDNVDNLPKWAKDLLNQNKDQLEGKKGFERAYLGLPSYNQFRILSEVNNLEIITQDGEVKKLTDEEKQKLIAKLNKKAKITFDSLKSFIGHGKKAKFNLESDSRKELVGNKIEFDLSKKDYFGDKWEDFSLQEKDGIAILLIEEDKKEVIQKELLKFDLDDEQLEKICEYFPEKRTCGNLSKEILHKLIDVMQKNNCRYDEGCVLLGLHHSHKGDVKISGHLEYYGKVLQASTVPVKSGDENEMKYGKIANPTVHIALNQLQKVINEILQDYGNPQQVNIEIARDLKISKKDKDRIISQQKKNEIKNDKVKEELAKLNPSITPSRNNMTKYKLWEELKQANDDYATCVFSGDKIDLATLFSNEIEVEHILPFSRTLDDSFNNKTITFRNINALKRDRSPHQAFKDNYDDILQRANRLPFTKYKRFLPDALEKYLKENSFIERQLNDTRYLSKIVKDYLQTICKKESILVSTGQLTALLRHHFGLNKILNENDENTKQREDHRHHAIDAIIVALIDRGFLQNVARKNSFSRLTDDNFSKRIKIEEPLNDLRQDIEKSINEIIVSHRIDHGKEAQFHEETNYGILKKDESIKIGEDLYENDYTAVYRKKLTDLDQKTICQIRDNDIREELITLTKGKSAKEIEGILHDYSKNNNIKTIRILKKIQRKYLNPIIHKQNVFKEKTSKLQEINHQKGVEGERNYFIAIWKLPNFDFKHLFKMRQGTKFDKAFNELSQKSQENYHKFKEKLDQINGFVNKEDGDYAVTCVSYFKFNKFGDNYFKPHPCAKLLGKIYGGDTIKFLDKDNEEIIGKVVELNPNGNRIMSKLVSSSSSESKRTSISFSNFRNIALRKIFVSPSGKIKDSGSILK